MPTGFSLSSPHKVQLQPYEDSRITVSGGSVGELFSVYGNSQIIISAGSLYGLQALNNSQIVFSGGSISHNLYGYDGSHIEMTGGVVNGQIKVRNEGQMQIYGGFVDGRIWATGLSQIFFSGGAVVDDLVADSFSVLTIYGSDFAVDSQPFGYGELVSILGGDYGDESTRHLSGTLANGDQLDNNFYIGHDASIVLVPEPATLLLLGLGASMLRRRR